jgi:predicted dehydrogenase
MKIAVIGTGGMGANHIEAYKYVKGLEVCAVVDMNFEAAEKYSKVLNCRAYCNIDEMLADIRPDAVDICVPSFLHYEYSLKCIERGMHVFCEKPMAHSVGEADEMIAKAKEKGVKMMVGQVLRYWPEYRYLKQQIADESLGRLRYLSLRRYYGVHPQGSWYMNPDLCKMVCYEMHIHDTDMVNYLFGLPDAVHSVGIEQPDIHMSYINTHYIFNNKDITVVAEGGWNDSTFPWSSGYLAVFEHGLIEYKDGKVAVYPAGKDFYYAKMETLTGVPSEIDGVYQELTEFAAILNGDSKVTGVTPESARDTIYLVGKECESLQKNAVVTI